MSASRAVLTATVVAAALIAGARIATAQEREGADFQARRDAYFEKIRAYPFDSFPARTQDRFRLRTNLVAGGASFATSAAGSWLPIGPGGLFGSDGYYSSSPQTDAGRVEAIALDRASANRMFIATPGGGIWRTADGGASWRALTDDQCSLRMGAVSIDPVNPSIVYAGVYASAASNACGVFRSSDGGDSWTNLGTGGFTFFTGGVWQILVDSATAGNTTSGVILLADNSGVVRSQTSGATWAVTMPGRVYSIAALPASSSTVFAGGIYSDTSKNGVYRSTDKGLTWSPLPRGGLPFGSAIRIQLATSKASPNSVWALVAGSSNNKFLGLYRWDDTAQQWTTLGATGLYGQSRGDFGSQGSYDLVIAVDPVDANRIYIAGVRAYASTNGGATFARTGLEIHCDWHSLVIDPANPSHLVAGTDGGIFTSYDRGESWLSLNNNLGIAQYYPGVSLHPSSSTVILGGAQDNGSHEYNGTSLWAGITGGDGGYTAMNPLDPTIQYTTCQWGGLPCIYRRSPTVNLNSPRYIGSGIATTDRAVFIPPLVIDPLAPKTLYFGTQRLWRTTTEGSSWTAISGDLSKGSGAILTIAVAPSDDRFLYVGTTDGNVQVSRDAGTTFTLSTTGLPNRAVTRLSVDSQDSLRAIASMSGIGTGHVFLTTDGGTTWTNITGNLPDAPTNVAIGIPDQPNHLFAGNDIGVYETLDGGTTWSRAPAGMPYVMVYDLVYNPTLQLLVAATHGRGMFQYSLGSAVAVLRGDVNRDTKIDSFDALLIQQAMVGTPLTSGLTAMPQGDANCDGALQTSDALTVLRSAVGLTTAGACVGTIK